MMKNSTSKFSETQCRSLKWFVAFSLMIFSCFFFTNAIAQNGKSLHFDGVNDFINIPQTLAASDYTKEMWFRTESTGVLQNLFSGSSTALYIDGNNEVSGGNLVEMGSTPFVVTPNVWYHVAITYNSGTNELKLYQNGSLVKTVGSANIYGFEHSLQIGAFGSSFNFHGSIDEVRFWNVARTDAEILANYQCEIDHTSPNLIAYYTFDQGIAGGNNTTLPYALDVRDVCHPENGSFMNFAMTGATSNFVAVTPIVGACSAQPEIRIVGQLAECIDDGDNVPSVDKGTDFGVMLNTPIVHTFTIRNHGTATLNVSGITSSSPADFVVGGATFPIALASNDSTTFTITFTPVAPYGSKLSTITVSSDDADEASYEFDVTGQNAVTGSSLSFGGFTSLVQTPIAFTGTSYTKEMWFYTRSLTGIQNMFTGTTTALYLDNGRLGGGNIAELSDPAQVNLSEWTHVAITFEDMGGTGTSSLYKNGVLIHSVTGVLTPTETPLQIGAFSGGFYFDGLVDEVRFWNVARTAAEIANSYNCAVNADAPGLVAYYKFNQGVAGLSNTSETTLYDITCNKNHGTLFGFGLNGVMENWVNNPSPATTTCGGAAPDINISGLNNCILNGDVSPSVTDNTNFGLYNSPGNDHVFWMHNLGDAPLNVTSFTITGVNSSSFTLIVAPATTIGVGDSTSFTIRFASTANGPKYATITITTNDPNEGSYSFVVEGEGMGPVPVSLLTFTGAMNNKFVDLKWTTTNEINNNGFEVLRSNGSQQNWTSIGFVSASGMNNANYLLTDYAPMQGVNAYRLKQIDHDGTVAYSHIVVVNYSGAALVRTFPNPFKNQFTLAFNDQALINTSANILSANGVRLARIKISGFNQTINMESYAPGVYLLQLHNGEVLKMIKK